MTVWVAMLRGINVGGRNTLAMADLRRLVGDLGHADVATYIQSGNVVFSSHRNDREAMSDEISDAIKGHGGLSVSVVMRTSDEMAAIARRHPHDGQFDPKLLHVVFLAATPRPGAAAVLDPHRYAPDRWFVDGSEVYVTYPEGSARSKLTLDVFERQLGTSGTARNLNTVRKLVEFARPAPEA